MGGPRTSGEGWSAHQQRPPFPTYTFYREYARGGGVMDALVFVYRREAGYEVRSRLEARATGPYDEGEGHRPTLDEALALAAEVRLRLDERYG